jgi:hypothetical protein
MVRGSKRTAASEKSADVFDSMKEIFLGLAVNMRREESRRGGLKLAPH